MLPAKGSKRSARWVGKLFGRERPAHPPAFALPDGKRVYAIGDVHGQFELLLTLLEQVREDASARGPAEVAVVLLGDLVDRGPATKDVVEMAAGWSADGARLITLRGNHEALLLSLIEGESVRLNSWLTMGGLQTLRSYGLSDAALSGMETGKLINAARAAIPDRHLAFLRSLPSHWRCGDYVFAHAGIRPGLPLEEQSERDLLTVRNPFLDSTADHGFVVVHGHSATAEVTDLPNRIGLDTGAFATGRLSAVGLERATRWFLST